MLTTILTSWLGVPTLRPFHDLAGYKNRATLAAPFYNSNPTGLMAETECPRVQLKGALFNHIPK